MLVEEFYSIENINQSENLILAQISLNPDHKLYKGHFPEQPVVPGVMQLQIVKELMETNYDRTLSIKKIRQIKYITPIIPDDHIKLSFELVLKESLKVVFKITSGDILFSKGSIELG